MNYEQSVEYILSIPLFGKKNGHHNTEALLREFGNPQDSMKTIHVAGTNGKGSVCSMLSYIYCEAGLKVGFFSSPHLIRINERFKINNEDITDENFLACFLKVHGIIEQMIKAGQPHPTFFETLFCMAMVYFADQGVELVILETGLGGRLDATNMIKQPLVSVITQIDYDHVAILGNTLQKIAAEKGGIIKQDCPTVLQSDQNEVVEVIENICLEQKSKLYPVQPIDYLISKRTYKTIDFSIQNKYYYYDRLTLNSSAPYQILNAATALTTVQVLACQIAVEQSEVVRALEKFYWPGRMDVVHEGLILDGAHNLSGIKAFTADIHENYSNRRITLLFAAMKDKAYDEMIEEICKCESIKRIILTTVHEERCLELPKMEETFRKYCDLPIEIENNIEKVIEQYKTTNGDLLCCVGSLYLVGEVKRILSGGY
ncbi:MAG: bifunctional folylpolyglutamate synthase/dihydrofolate synthase [Vallitaleaceae bacterium]|nr:bifunctional folylpolyglutamate synthase/dihydrofolate synthase [Vallitaleaceae bacterium]